MDVNVSAVDEIDSRSRRLNRSCLANAYGFLWLYHGTDKTIHAARRVILALLDKHEQEHGVEVATKFRSEFGQYIHRHDFDLAGPEEPGFYRVRLCRCGAKLSELR